MDTLLWIAISLITHVCKPPFRRRAQQIDGSAAGVMSALIFTLLSIASLGAALLTVATILF